MAQTFSTFKWAMFHSKLKQGLLVVILAIPCTPFKWHFKAACETDVHVEVTQGQEGEKIVGIYNLAAVMSPMSVTTYGKSPTS